jgi:membrane protease YdiL (CAAX protease family)
MREGSVGEGAADGGRAGMSRGRAARLVLEFFVLYAGVPTLAAVNVRLFAGLLFPTLITGGVVLGILLWRDPTFERRRLMNVRAMREWWWRVLALVGLFAVALWGALAAWDPESLFYLPRERTWLWVAIMFFYPLLSVYPQEVIFRTWLFHRYKEVLPAEWMRVAASTVAFGYAHIMFQHWIPLAMTTIGGFVFARTYVRSKSTFVVAVEHGLYGMAIFTIGLGRFFYLGAVGR